MFVDFTSTKFIYFFLYCSSTYPALRVTSACPTRSEGSKDWASLSQGGTLFFSERKKEKKRSSTRLGPEVSGIVQHSGLQAASDRRRLFCFDSNLMTVCTETHSDWFLAVVS